MFNDFINKYCLSHQSIGDVTAARKKFNRAANDCKWLAAARNEHAMHYTEPDDWRSALKLMNDNQMKYEAIISANRHSNLFSSSDVASFFAFVLEANQDDWRSGAEKISNEGIDLGTSLIDLLQLCFVHFIETVRGDKGLHDLIKIEEMEDFARPAIEKYELPFFFNRATEQD